MDVGQCVSASELEEGCRTRTQYCGERVWGVAEGPAYVRSAPAETSMGRGLHCVGEAMSLGNLHRNHHYRSKSEEMKRKQEWSSSSATCSAVSLGHHLLAQPEMEPAGASEMWVRSPHCGIAVEVGQWVVRRDVVWFQAQLWRLWVHSHLWQPCTRHICFHPAKSCCLHAIKSFSFFPKIEETLSTVRLCVHIWGTHCPSLG